MYVSPPLTSVHPSLLRPTPSPPSPSPHLPSPPSPPLTSPPLTSPHLPSPPLLSQFSTLLALALPMFMYEFVQPITFPSYAHARVLNYSP